MSVVAMSLAAVAGVALGWAAPGWQRHLYRLPEQRAAGYKGRKLLAARATLAAAGAAVAAVAFRPGHYGLGPALLTAAFGGVLLVGSSTDLEQRLIPNRLSYPAMMAATVLCWAWPDRSVESILLGGAVGLVAGALLYVAGVVAGGRSGPALGLGDAKLVLLIGLLVGWPAVMYAVVLGTLIAGLPAVALMVTGRTRTFFSYGPYLAAGALIVLLWPRPFV